VNYLIILLSLLFISPSSEKKVLTLNITNIETIKGTIEIGIFNTNERFLEEGQAYKTTSVKVTADKHTVVFKDLPPGNYAVSMYHDVNADGECNRNFMGIPKEPYGFSNNFRPRFSAPTFKDCEFTLDSNKTLKIELKG
tara:strand:- start:397 stop:813 length:417 start_codon:yes stop_codon:yes gene_type:complete